MMLETLKWSNGGKMNDRIFLKNIYNGSDGDDFITDFVEYLKDVVENGKWSAMSYHKLYLDGANQAIKEIISEMESDIHSE